MTVLLAPLSIAFILIRIAVFAVTVWALVDAATRPPGAYIAAERLTKPAWVTILAVAVFVAAIGLGIFMIAGLVAALVYLLDVRPRVREYRSRGGWV